MTNEDRLMVPLICEQCGAPLDGLMQATKCGYCGTPYGLVERYVGPSIVKELLQPTDWWVVSDRTGTATSTLYTYGTTITTGSTSTYLTYKDYLTCTRAWGQNGE